MNFLWIGLFFVLIGFGLILLHLSSEADSVRTEGGGLVMIGPVPILFGSSSRSAFIALVLSVTVLVLVYAFLYFKVL